MRMGSVPGLLALCMTQSVGACVAPSPSTTGTTLQMSPAPPVIRVTTVAPLSAPTVPSPPPGGGAVVSAVGTPALIALKVPLCVATIAVAAPGVAIASLSTNSDGVDEQRYFAWGVESNCGPPWAVTP